MLGSWVKKVKGISKNNNQEDKPQYGDDQSKRGWGKVEEGKQGINGGGKSLGSGCMIQYS